MLIGGRESCRILSVDEVVSEKRGHLREADGLEICCLPLILDWLEANGDSASTTAAAVVVA